MERSRAPSEHKLLTPRAGRTRTWPPGLPPRTRKCTLSAFGGRYLTSAALKGATACAEWVGGVVSNLCSCVGGECRRMVVDAGGRPRRPSTDRHWSLCASHPTQGPVTAHVRVRTGYGPRH